MSRYLHRKKQNVFRVLWRTYIRHALIPIIFIELALITTYLVTNYRPCRVLCWLKWTPYSGQWFKLLPEMMRSSL
jgi:hypothetical protein